MLQQNDVTESGIGVQNEKNCSAFRNDFSLLQFEVRAVLVPILMV